MAHHNAFHNSYKNEPSSTQNTLDPRNPHHPLNLPRPYSLAAPPAIPLSTLAPKPISWLWPNRIPRGKVTLLAGDPGIGKSFLALDLAARLSSGQPLPDEPPSTTPKAPASVILLAAEDDPIDSLIPRLNALNANLSNIQFIDPVPHHYIRQIKTPTPGPIAPINGAKITARWFDKGFDEMGWPNYEHARDDSTEINRINRVRAAQDYRQAATPSLRRNFDLTDPECLVQLKAALSAHKHSDPTNPTPTPTPPPQLLIIDPITAFIGDTDASSSRIARITLANLADIAAEFNIAILAITHLTKNQRAKSIHRTTGALSWVITSRVVYALEANPNQPPTLKLVKTNIPLNTQPLSFTIHPPNSETNNTTAASWALAPEAPPNPEPESKLPCERELAEQFLADLLADGPLPQTEIEDAAHGHAFSQATIRRAKHMLKIESFRSDGPQTQWLWQLPQDDDQPPPDLQPDSDSPPNVDPAPQFDPDPEPECEPARDSNSESASESESESEPATDSDPASNNSVSASVQHPAKSERLDDFQAKTPLNRPHRHTRMRPGREPVRSTPSYSPPALPFASCLNSEPHSTRNQPPHLLTPRPTSAQHLEKSEHLADLQAENARLHQQPKLLYTSEPHLLISTCPTLTKIQIYPQSSHILHRSQLSSLPILPPYPVGGRSRFFVTQFGWRRLSHNPLTPQGCAAALARFRDHQQPRNKPSGIPAASTTQHSGFSGGRILHLQRCSPDGKLHAHGR